MGEREREREKEKKRELKKKETKIIDKKIGDRPRTLATKRTRSEGEGGKRLAWRAVGPESAARKVLRWS